MPRTEMRLMKYVITGCRLVAMLTASTTLVGCSDLEPTRTVAPAQSVATAIVGHDVDAQLRQYLATLSFTGRVAGTLEARLGRRIDPQLADLGRLLWFDRIQGLN